MHGTMADTNEIEGVDGDAKKLQNELAESVRRSLLQLGDMKALEQRMLELSKKISDLTPPPEQSPG